MGQCSRPSFFTLCWGWLWFTLESNFFHLIGQPPLGGAVGAAVVLVRDTVPRLQMDMLSWPQLQECHKPVSRSEIDWDNFTFEWLSMAKTWIQFGVDFMNTVLTPVIRHNNTAFIESVRVRLIFVPPLHREWSLIHPPKSTQVRQLILTDWNLTLDSSNLCSWNYLSYSNIGEPYQCYYFICNSS